MVEDSLVCKWGFEMGSYIGKPNHFKSRQMAAILFQSHFISRQQYPVFKWLGYSFSLTLWQLDHFKCNLQKDLFLTFQILNGLISNPHFIWLVHILNGTMTKWQPYLALILNLLIINSSLVCRLYFKIGLNLGQTFFERAHLPTRQTFCHLNTGQVWYSNPRCTI